MVDKINDRAFRIVLGLEFSCKELNIPEEEVRELLDNAYLATQAPFDRDIFQEMVKKISDIVRDRI